MKNPCFYMCNISWYLCNFIGITNLLILSQTFPQPNQVVLMTRLNQTVTISQSWPWVYCYHDNEGHLTMTMKITLLFVPWWRRSPEEDESKEKWKTIAIWSHYKATYADTVSQLAITNSWNSCMSQNIKINSRLCLFC